MNLQVLIDARNIAENIEQIGWRSIKVKTGQRSVAAVIIETIRWRSIVSAGMSHQVICHSPLDEKSEAPSGTRMYDIPAAFAPSVATEHM